MLSGPYISASGARARRIAICWLPNRFGPVEGILLSFQSVRLLFQDPWYWLGTWLLGMGVLLDAKGLLRMELNPFRICRTNPEGKSATWRPRSTCREQVSRQDLCVCVCVCVWVWVWVWVWVACARARARARACACACARACACACACACLIVWVRIVVSLLVCLFLWWCLDASRAVTCSLGWLEVSTKPYLVPILSFLLIGGLVVQKGVPIYPLQTSKLQIPKSNQTTN